MRKINKDLRSSLNLTNLINTSFFIRDLFGAIYKGRNVYGVCAGCKNTNQLTYRELLLFDRLVFDVLAFGELLFD